MKYILCLLLLVTASYAYASTFDVRHTQLLQELTSRVSVVPSTNSMSSMCTSNTTGSIGTINSMKTYFVRSYSDSDSDSDTDSYSDSDSECFYSDSDSDYDLDDDTYELITPCFPTSSVSYPIIVFDITPFDMYSFDTSVFTDYPFSCYLDDDGDAVECALCQVVISEFQSEITEDEIVNDLDTFCYLLSDGSFESECGPMCPLTSPRSECLEVMQEIGPLMYSFLVSTPPQTLCTLLGMC